MTDEYNESEIELAKKLACAAISHQLHISYQYYWKNYLKTDETGSPWPVGTAWIELGRFVQRHILSGTLDRLLSDTTSPTDPALQVRLLELAHTLPDEDLQLAISFLETRANHYQQSQE